MQVNGFLNSSYLRINDQSYTSNSNSSQQSSSAQNSDELSSSDKALIAKLQASDTKVRQHEAAHIAAGAGVIKSGANFTYQKGPDNKLYAIGGEVSIDTGEEATPEQTIPKMQTVRAAALAPSDPSATDYQVASTATMMEMKARLELSQMLREDTQKSAVNEYVNNEDNSSSFSQYA